jgi:hypothetical protein
LGGNPRGGITSKTGSFYFDVEKLPPPSWLVSISRSFYHLL